MDFKDIEFELYGNVVQMKNILSYYNSEDERIDDLDACAKLIKSKKYCMAVVGEFRRGKSSLINALLGLKVLPADVTPTTATINRITFGTEPEVSIYYKDGTKEKIAIEELQNYVTKLSDEQEERASRIREAVVSYPTVICQNHVDIIDTPGLNDDESMTGITLQLLNDIDAVLVAVSALSPFSEVEKGFVADLIARETISDVVFVVTFIDQVEDEDLPRLLENIRQRIQQNTMEEVIRRYGGQEEIVRKAERILKEHFKLFAVSSYQALQAFVTGNRKLLKSSRFPFFKEELYKLLTARQSVHVVEQVTAAIHRAAQGFDRIYQNKFSVIESRIAGLQEALSLTRRYYGEKESWCQKMLSDLSDAMERILAGVQEENWQLKPVFCKKLHGIRQNDGRLIVQAIREAGQESCAKAESLTVKLAGEIRELSEKAERELAGRRQSFFDTVPPLVIGEVAFSSQEEWLEQIEKERMAIPAVSFQLEGELIPEVPRIEHCNIITYIEPVLGRSLEALRERERSWAENAFAILKKSIDIDDGLKEPAEASLQAQLDSAQKALLVCQGNYELHQTMVRGLVESTESLKLRPEEDGEVKG